MHIFRKIYIGGVRTTSMLGFCLNKRETYKQQGNSAQKFLGKLQKGVNHDAFLNIHEQCNSPSWLNEV